MDKLQEIHNWLKEADAMVINTGAGMGVDSGMADFRGDDGQWGMVESQKGKSVFDMMNPDMLNEDPTYLWKIYALRLREYTQTVPHAGFNILKKWIEQFQLDYFINTSNIDGHFQNMGFNIEKIRELHGSIYYMQCSKPCSNKIWEHKLNADNLLVEINKGDYPKCQKCGAIARPNIYMFRDHTFLPHRTNIQEKNFQHFLDKNKIKKIIVFEIGSGPHVQSIRKKTRMLGIKYQAKIVRINPKDSKIREPHIGMAKGALEALTEINLLVNTC